MRTKESCKKMKNLNWPSNKHSCYEPLCFTWRYLRPGGGSPAPAGRCQSSSLGRWWWAAAPPDPEPEDCRPAAPRTPPADPGPATTHTTGEIQGYVWLLTERSSFPVLQVLSARKKCIFQSGNYLSGETYFLHVYLLYPDQNTQLVYFPKC